MSGLDLLVALDELGQTAMHSALAHDSVATVGKLVDHVVAAAIGSPA